MVVYYAKDALRSRLLLLPKAIEATQARYLGTQLKLHLPLLRAATVERA